MSKVRVVVHETPSADAARRALVHLLAAGLEAEALRSGHGDVALWRVVAGEDDAGRALAVLAEADASRAEAAREARGGPVDDATAGGPAALAPPGIWTLANSASSAMLGLFLVAIHASVHAGGGAGRSAMVDAGAAAPWLVWGGEWWRLGTAALLHFDLKHLVGNLSSLAFLGPPLAAQIGSARMLAVFAATAVAGNLASQLLGNEAAVKAGASGGICGLLGALAGFALVAMAAATDARSRRPAWQTLGALVALFGMMVGFAPGSDHYAHVGGLVAGLVVGRLMAPGLAPASAMAAVAVFLVAALVLPAGAGEPAAPDEPPPGTVVGADNLERWGAFLPPSIRWAVERGMRIEVVAPRDIPLEPKRLEATQKYHAQCRLSPDGNQVLNYVAGLPFPLADQRDPQAAVKLAFNFENRIVVDDLDVRNFECDTGSIGSTTGLSVERHFLIGHFRRLYYVGRLYHDPKPTWPTPDGVRYREVMHPIVEPFDLKGVGLTYTRHVDWARQDDSWLYYPLLKRVRRLSSAQRSDALFGQDADIDSYGGYAGNPAWMDWRLLGTRRVLAPMHTRHFPAVWSRGAADFLFDDDWEMRDVYVLEGTSRLPEYAYSKRVLYLDRHSFVIPYTEMYDRQGQLWKAWVNQFNIGRKVFPGAVRASYDFEQQFIPALSIFDMQLMHATRCLLPSPAVAGEEGWYFNFGPAEGTVEDAFSVSSIIASGR